MDSRSVIKVKICGLTHRQDVQAAIEAGCDYCGFVHHRTSPRHLEAEAMAELTAMARACGIQTVMVISDPDLEYLEGLAGRAGPDIIQCHGTETPEMLKALRLRLPDCGVWKAVFVRERADLEKADQFAGIADALVLDAPPPRDADRGGGWGEVFDWSLLKASVISLPYLLAGGLGPGNVGRAIAETKAWGVDVSSGIEAEPGRKDLQKMATFIKEARRAGRIRKEGGGSQ